MVASPRNQPFIENKPVISGLISFVIFRKRSVQQVSENSLACLLSHYGHSALLGSRTQLAVSAP
jgi:hypothetical protein